MTQNLTGAQALARYMAALQEAPRASTNTGAIPDFVYAFHSDDLTYGTDEYPVSGVFSATTTPWLADINTIPSSQRWTAADQADQAARAQQSAQESSYAKANVPGQHYSGSAADQIGQRFSQGMFDPSVFSAGQIAALTGNWIVDDGEFARQRLGAANPNVIARYDGSLADLTTLLANGTGSRDVSALTRQLADALAQKTLYWTDYSAILGPVASNNYVRNGQYFSVPRVFFIYVKATGQLLPATIQLTPNGYWFTPADDANSWLAAKLHAASADAQWWFSGTHLFNSHSIDMVFGIAALNLVAQGRLDLDHPILMLINPHLKKVYDINNAVYDYQGSGGIYRKGQFCDLSLPTGRIGIYQIINGLYQNYDFDANAFDTTLSARGMDNSGYPGAFPYRDDGQVWWDAIAGFAAGVVTATYSDDAAVAGDVALNAWMRLVQSAFNHDGTTRFTWTPTVAGLTRTMTNLMFVTTVQHTAVNNTMFDAYAFLPNGAFAMTGAPPSGPGVSDAGLLAALPDPQDSGALADAILGQIGFVMAGTATVPYLAWGDGSLTSLQAMYPYDAHTQPGQYQAVAQYYQSLQAAKTTIAQQQQQREAAYKQANPAATTIPNSVSYPYLAVDAVMACIQI